MKKYFSSFLFTLFMTGCGNNVAFEPNNLPDGYVGQKYYVPITISGGTGPVVDFNYDIHPSNSGLKLTFAEKNIIQNIYIITSLFKVSQKQKEL
ncbi:hypothetical protein [Pantoea sp. WMus005]|uniref:hypothetical protein n=1 Tax=Pantoea sp. WMus005 TaxID=2750734 RepID=UPI0015CFBAB9|nr:hypothetical protein [Pantoea sp. WMus005]NYS28402.1 hypothetical protein [Pantoea sp. WMus005]